MFSLITFSLYSQLLFENMKAKAVYYHIIKKDDQSKNKYLDKTEEVWTCRLQLVESFMGYDLNFVIAPSYSDYFMEEVFSYGSYIEKGNQIILTDQVYNYKMYLTKKGNTVQFTKGLTWFNNKVFELDLDRNLELGRWHNRDIDIEGVRKRNQKDYPDYRTVYPGIYQQDNYSLELLSDKQYNLYFCKIVILHGKWSVKDGEVLLHHSKEFPPFSLRVTDKGLKSQLLPGDYKGIVLKKIK